MPTRRSAGVAIVHDGLIHAPGGTEVGGSSGSLRNQAYRTPVSCR